MPRLDEIINSNTKNKLKNMKNNMSGDVVSGSVVNDGTSHAIKNSFVGATPNLNSSLGVNAADGDPATTVDSSKLNTLYTQNKDIISGTLDRLFGAQPTPTSTGIGGNTPPPPAKAGMAWYWWALIALVVLVIIFFIIKAVRK